MLYDKLSKGEDNKWIQGKGNGECLLDMVGVDAVALGHIMAVNELIKADGTLQRPQTTIINLSAGKGIQYKHMIGSEVEKDGKSYWGQPPAEPVPAKVVSCLAGINETWCNIFGKALLSPYLARVSLNFTQRTYIFSNKTPGRCIGIRFPFSAVPVCVPNCLSFPGLPGCIFTGSSFAVVDSG